MVITDQHISWSFSLIIIFFNFTLSPVYAETRSVLFGSIDGMLIVVQEELPQEEEEESRWTQRQIRLFQEPVASLDVSRHKDPAECLIRATTESGKHKLSEKTSNNFPESFRKIH